MCCFFVCEVMDRMNEETEKGMEHVKKRLEGPKKTLEKLVKKGSKHTGSTLM